MSVESTDAGQAIENAGTPAYFRASQSAVQLVMGLSLLLLLLSGSLNTMLPSIILSKVGTMSCPPST